MEHCREDVASMLKHMGCATVDQLFDNLGRKWTKGQIRGALKSIAYPRRMGGQHGRYFDGPCGTYHPKGIPVTTEWKLTPWRTASGSMLEAA